MKNDFKTTAHTLTNTDWRYNYVNQESASEEEDLWHNSVTRKQNVRGPLQQEVDIICFLVHNQKLKIPGSKEGKHLFQKSCSIYRLSGNSLSAPLLQQPVGGH